MRHRNRQIHRLHRYKIPRQRYNQQNYNHRHLELNRIKAPEENIRGSYPDQYTAGIDHDFDFYLRNQRRPGIVSGKRQIANERQAGLAGLFAGNPAGAGVAWFASLIGLAAIAREPLSTVLDGVSPWDQILNSK